MAAPFPVFALANVRRAARAALVIYTLIRAQALFLLGVIARVTYRASWEGFYNILWAVVFGFATLNILSLAAKRFEPTRRGLTFGELMAVSIVGISIFLLGWEILHLLHIFPIRLRR